MLCKCQEASPVPGLQIPQCSMLLLEPWSATKTPANLIRDVDLDSQFLRPGPIGNISPAEPRRDGAGFPTSVRQLNADILTLAMSKLDNSLEWRDLRIFPEPGVFRGDSTFGCHSRSLYHGEAWPAHRHSTEMGKMPIRVVAILGGILAQG